MMRFLTNMLRNRDVNKYSTNRGYLLSQLFQQMARPSRYSTPRFVNNSVTQRENNTEQSSGAGAKSSSVDVKGLLNLAKSGYNLAKSTGLLGSSGVTSGLSAASVAGGAPSGFTGVATGEAFGGGAAASSAPAWGSLAGAGAFVSLAAFVASKIYKSATTDKAGLDFIGGGTKYLSSGTPNWSSEHPFSNAYMQNSYVHTIPGKLGTKSSKFDYSIAAKETGSDQKIVDQTINYLDNEFSKIQSNTSVDINDAIKYAFEATNFTSGESPADMTKRVIDKVNTSIKTGVAMMPRGADYPNLPSYAKGKYVSGYELVDYDKGQGSQPAPRKYSGYDGRKPKISLGQKNVSTGVIDPNAKKIPTRNELGETNIYRVPLFSDMPTFKADPGYNSTASSGADETVEGLIERLGLPKLRP